MGTIDNLLVSLRRLVGLSRPAEPPVPPAPIEAPDAEPVAPAVAAIAEPIAPEPAPEPPVAVVEPTPAVAAPPPAEPEPVVAPEPTVAVAPVTEIEDAAPTEHAASPSGGVLLRLESERDGTPTFDVAKTGATIGRGPENSIRLDDLSVSRKHAKITYRQGAYWLSDLGSMGGTWVDGAKLAQPRRISAGQVIDIGVCRMTVADAPAGQDEPVETGAARRRR